MRPTTGPTRKDGVKQKHSVFRKSSQPPKVEFFVGKLEAPIPSMNLFDLVIYINLFTGDVYKPRRPGDAGHRALGAGRGDTAGLGQGDSKSQADRSKQQAASLITPAQGQRP